MNSLRERRLSFLQFFHLPPHRFAQRREVVAAFHARLRPTTWNVSNVLGYNYNYDYFNERTGRVSYASSIYDSTLDRSYEYDHVGRLVIAHSGAEARAHAYSGQWGTMDGPFSLGFDYDVWGNMTHRYGWGGEVQGGGAGQSSDIWIGYTNNKRDGFSYDAAGHLTYDWGQNFTYDVTGQQTSASYSGYSLSQEYDGDGLRVKKSENGAVTLYLRSTVLGGRVVAELNGSGTWTRGYVYTGSSLLAVQQGGVNWMHEDPVTKSKRVTDVNGNIVSMIELDPWGADTNRSSNQAFQPKRFTSYERDGNASDEAMFRRYNRWHSRFDQPDPYDGSYNLGNPQSFNRYAYVQNDPVNFIDPSGLCSWIAYLNPDGSIASIVWLTPCIVNSLPGGGNGGGGRGVGNGNAFVIEIGGLEPGGGGGGGGGGGFGGNPFIPRSQPQPPNQQSQQKDFDDCARKAWRQYHEGYWKNVGKMFAGVTLTMVGLYVGYRGIPGGGPGGGIGISAMRTSQGIEGALATGKVGQQAGLSLALPGSLLVVSSFKGLENTFSNVINDVNKCKSQFPNANHALQGFSL